MIIKMWYDERHYDTLRKEELHNIVNYHKIFKEDGERKEPTVLAIRRWLLSERVEAEAWFHMVLWWMA